MELRKITVGYGALRLAYSLALLAAPVSLTKRWLGPATRQAPTEIAVRGLATRDVVLALGVLVSAVRGESSQAWLLGCAVSDGSDLLSTVLAKAGDLPAGSKRATIVVASFSGAAATALAVGGD